MRIHWQQATLAAIISTALLSGCSVRHDREAMVDNTEQASEVNIYQHDNYEQYSQAMQIMYVYTEREPTRLGNADVLAKNYYDTLANKNTISTTATAVMLIGNLASSLDITTFFFGTQTSDKLPYFYKYQHNIAIEPIEDDVTYDSIYREDLDRLKQLMSQKFPNAEIFVFEQDFLNVRNTSVSAMDITKPECAEFRKSDEFSPDTVFVDEEFDHCFLSTRRPNRFKKIVEGEIDFIEGIPKANRYLVYSVSDEMMSTYEDQSHFYRYVPYVGWMDFKDQQMYESNPDKLHEDIEAMKTSPYPYLYRYSDNKVLLFKTDTTA
ncbi:hypothetical protein [Photobacterium kasasachensis]|uniref:hypothetical protein n=1 Tax=Photobacterium kasasachensis TaxID=2910240 RepID=UPI003D0B1C07